MNYQISLPQFEGPFDLLLFFIERDELDIYNIPIYKLTEDFLSYIHQLETLNIELASEFILFVSTLMRIKAKMLLPRRRDENSDASETDPRQELVNKILEYKRFKEAAAGMALLEAERLLQQKRGNIAAEMHTLSEVHGEGTEIQAVSLHKLMSAFEKVMKRLQYRLEKPQHVVVKYNYSQEGQRAWLSSTLEVQQRMSFSSVFQHCENRIHAIFTFLSMLELVQQRYLSILIGEGRNNFVLEWNADRNDSGPADEVAYGGVKPAAAPAETTAAPALPPETAL